MPGPGLDILKKLKLAPGTVHMIRRFQPRRATVQQRSTDSTL